MNVTQTGLLATDHVGIGRADEDLSCRGPETLIARGVSCCIRLLDCSEGE